MHFVIDRELWRCGGDEEENHHGQGFIALLNRQGFSDCLGQMCIQLGMSIFDIRHIQTPDLLPDVQKEKLVPILIKDEDGTMTQFAESIMDINDTAEYEDATRESMLIEQFKAHGHELTFTGKYKDVELEEVNNDLGAPVAKPSPYEVREGEAIDKTAFA